MNIRQPEYYPAEIQRTGHQRAEANAMQDQKDTSIEQYMISSALIVSGLCSIVQVMRFKIPTFGLYKSGRLFLGTGMVSVMGTSFTFLPVRPLLLLCISG